MLKDLVRGRGVKIMVLWAPGQELFKEAWVDVCGIFYLCLLLSDPFPLSFLRWFGIRLRSWLRDKSWNLTVFSCKTEPPVVQSWTLHLKKCCRIGSVRGFHWSSIHLIGPKNESLRLQWANILVVTFDFRPRMTCMRWAYKSLISALGPIWSWFWRGLFQSLSLKMKPSHFLDGTSNRHLFGFIFN